MWINNDEVLTPSLKQTIQRKNLEVLFGTKATIFKRSFAIEKYFDNFFVYFLFWRRGLSLYRCLKVFNANDN